LFRSTPLVLTWIVWFGSIALEALLCVRLIRIRSWNHFPRFTLFVAALGVESALLAWINASHVTWYGKTWIVTRGIALILECVAVVEIFSSWARSFPGIESVGQKLFATFLAAGLLVTIVTLPADATRGGWILAFQVTSVVNRGAHLFLAVSLGLMLGFFARFGGPVSPNLRRHTWTMFTFLIATAATYLLVTTVHAFWLSSVALPAVSLACLSAWLAAFRTGEDTRPEVNWSDAQLAEYAAAEALSARLVEFDEKIKLRGMLGLK
jgi:hypothetical protein